MVDCDLIRRDMSGGDPSGRQSAVDEIFIPCFHPFLGLLYQSWIIGEEGFNVRPVRILLLAAV